MPEHLGPPAGRFARRPALDLLRAAATLAVVFTHAAMAYVPQHGSWPADPADVSAALGVAAAWIHVVPMPIFWALTGYLAVGSLARLGSSAFLRARVRRLGVPLALGFVLVLPLTYGLLMYGTLRTRGGLAHGAAWSGATDYVFSGDFLRPVRLAHLWFLEYALLAYAATAGSFLILRRMSIRGRDRVRTLLSLLTSSPLRWVLASVVIFLALLAVPGPGIQEPSGVVPVPSLLVLYGAM